MRMDKPWSPEDWQLFTTSVSSDGPVSQAGLDLAAAALDRAENAVRAGFGAHDAYDQFIAPIAQEHDAVGAADTEPREVALEYLLEISGEDA